jgi:hypothetical protein
MSKLAAICGVDPSREECRATINAIGVRISCLSCPLGAVMSPESVVCVCEAILYDIDLAFFFRLATLIAMMT